MTTFIKWCRAMRRRQRLNEQSVSIIINLLEMEIEYKQKQLRQAA